MGLYTGKHVLVMGLGISGRAAAHLLLRQGAKVHGVDRNLAALEQQQHLIQLKQQGLIATLESEVDRALNYDFIVVSPGIPSEHPLLTQAYEVGLEVIGEIELGCRLVKNRIVGITGTNGKTTVTLLITHVLNYCGYKAVALGNVGVPFCQEIETIDPDVIILLELSSYQLETLSQEILDVGVILNITPDHLERYPGMEAYAATKFKMENCLKKKSLLYLEERILDEYPHLVKHKEVIRSYGYAVQNNLYSDLKYVYRERVRLFELPKSLQDRKNHDLENLMAAYGVSSVFEQVKPEKFIEAFELFKKPSHRIEFVAERQGVAYYDDSKGTNIDAVIRAVEYLEGPIILIAGGVDKGSPYTPWLRIFKDRVKYICAIGQAASKIQEQLSCQFPVTITKDLDQAVKKAASLAQKGDIVLLSPGCSSFDMFRDYAHRGEVFQKVVRDLGG